MCQLTILEYMIIYVICSLHDINDIVRNHRRPASPGLQQGQSPEELHALYRSTEIADPRPKPMAVGSNDPINCWGYNMI